MPEHFRREAGQDGIAGALQIGVRLHLRKPRAGWLFSVVNYAGWPLLLLYGISMFVYPALSGSWQRVQDVWDRWQTFNAGALAFVASLVAFNIAKFGEERQREREFIAAKAFLPSTLSGLIDYCRQSASVLNRLWFHEGDEPLDLQAPDFPSGYREVFSNCIRHANPAVGSYLSNVLVLLQVHDARLRTALEQPPEEGRHSFRVTLLTYLMRVGELRGLIGNLFNFARGETDFQEQKLTWEDFNTAFALFDLDVEDFVIDEKLNLKGYTQRWLDRGKGTSQAGA